MFDAHCHLHLKAFDGIREEVLKRARKNGVTGFLTCGVDDEDWGAALSLAAAEPDILAAVGFHPFALRRWPESEDAERAANLASFAAAHRPALAALGECGLDARLTDVPLNRQLRMLAAHLEAARALDLPVVIHCVRSHSELLMLLQKFHGTRGILHGFSGSLEQAKALLRLGNFVFSFGGALTLPSKKRQTLIRGLPAHLILAETDAPDGPAIHQQPEKTEKAENFPPEHSQASFPASTAAAADVPIEPMHLVRVVQAIAQLRRESEEAWMARIHANAEIFLTDSDGSEPAFNNPKE